MPKGHYEDLTGRRFGKLLVIKRVEDYYSKGGCRQVCWLCHCDCGVDKKIPTSSLKSGVKSCGCFRRDRMRRMKKRYCEYDLSGEYGVGYTHNRGSEFYFDKTDYDLIKNYCWNEHILSSGYHTLEAWEPETKKVVRFSWVIVGKYCDHVNRNPLDNRRCNLRPATSVENAANHSIQKSNNSGVIGVHWNKNVDKWVSTLRKNGSTIIHRNFDNFDDAVFARLLAEIAFFGDFAPQKHLFSKYGIKEGKNDLP